MTSTNTRNTWQRAAIRDELSRVDDFRTASQIHEDMRQMGAKVGLATVYRALQAMSETGEIDSLRTPEGEAAYRRCSDEGHHHHIVCRSCGRTVEISAQAVEAWAKEVAEQHGFSDAGHELEIFGLCTECS